MSESKLKTRGRIRGPKAGDQGMGRQPRPLRPVADHHAAAAVDQQRKACIGVTARREMHNGPEGPAVDDLEVPLVEAGDQATAAIAHDHGHGDQVECRPEGGVNLFPPAGRKSDSRHGQRRRQDGAK